MEFFQDAVFVRLRSISCNKYLYADEDGKSVSVKDLPTSVNSVWAVEHIHIDGDYIRLRGPYGRYLAVGDVPFLPVIPCRAIQHRPSMSDCHAVLWEPHRQPDDRVSLSAYSRNLCANGPLLGNSITVDRAKVREGMLWHVQAVPVVPQAPAPIVRPRTQWTRRLAERLPRPLSALTQARRVKYTILGDLTNLNRAFWWDLQFGARSVAVLKNTLAEQNNAVRELDGRYILCCRAGRHGHVAPLLVDLPHGKWTLEIVLVPEYSEVAQSFRYPVLNPA